MSIGAVLGFRPWAISYRCSFGTDTLSPKDFEILMLKRIWVTVWVTDLSRSRDVIGHVSFGMWFPIGVQLTPARYLELFARYLAINISGSRRWPSDHKLDHRRWSLVFTSVYREAVISPMNTEFELFFLSWWVSVDLEAILQDKRWWTPMNADFIHLTNFTKSFINYLPTPADLFNEIVDKVTPLIQTQKTNWRDPLPPNPDGCHHPSPPC